MCFFVKHFNVMSRNPKMTWTLGSRWDRPSNYWNGPNASNLKVDATFTFDNEKNVFASTPIVKKKFNEWRKKNPNVAGFLN